MERIHGVKRRIIAFVLVLAVTICSMNVYNEEEQVVASVANWPTTSMEQVRTMYELGNAFGSTMEGYTLYDITEESNSEAIECFDMYFNITGENNDILQLKQSITMKNDTYIVLDLGYQYTIDLAGYSVVGCVNEPLILLQDYEKDREQCMDSVTFIDSSESRTGTVQNTHTISGGIFGVGGVTTSESNYDLRIDSGNYICSTGDLLIRSGESRTIINGGRFVSEDADAFFYGSIIQGPCSFESTGRGSAFSGDMNVGSGSLQDIIPDDMYAYDRYGYLIENTSEIYVISDYFELDYARELIIDEREIVTINGQYDLLDSLKLCTIEGKWVDYIGTFEDITQTNYSIKVSRGAYSLAFIEDRDGATYYEINTGESYTAEQYNILIVKVVEESQEESGVNTTSNPIYNGRLGAAWDGYGPLYTFDGDGCFLYAPSEEVISFTYSWDKGTYRWEGIASTITSEFESDIELYSVSLEDEILYYRREADPFNKMEDPEKETALFTGWKVAVLGSESYTVKSFSEDTASLSDYRARCVSLYENFVSMDDLITEDSITAYNMETAFYDWKSNIEEPAMLPKLAVSLSNENVNELVNSGYDVEVSWFAYAEGETKEEARDLTDKVEELELGTIYLPEYFEDEALIPVGKYQYFAVVNILIDGDVVLSSETELIEIEILGYDLEVSNPSFDAVSYTGLPILEDILNSEAYWSEAVMDIEENMLVIGTDYVVSYQYGYVGDSELTDGLPTNVYRDYVIRVRIDPINGYESMYSSYIYETTLTIDKCPVVAKAEDKVILFNGLTVEEQLPEIRFEDGLGNFHEVSYYYTNRYFLDYLVGEEENVNGKSFQNGVPTDVGSYTIYESIPTDPPNHKLDSTNIMGLLGEYTYFFESNLLYKIVVAFAETVGILVNGENDVAEYYSTSEVSFQIPNGYEMFIWTQSSEEESDYIGLTFDEYAGLIQEIESGDRAGEWITEYESLKEDGEYYFLYSLREIETGNISDFKVVTFTKDTQAPTTLSIRVGSSTWDSILQVLTFGLYSPTTETIVLEGGVDESSDVSKYFYIRSVDRESMQYNTIYELEADAEWVSYNEEELPEIAVGNIVVTMNVYLMH